jgi:hypothetical protein
MHSVFIFFFFFLCSYCDDRERDNDRKVIFRCLYIGNFFEGLNNVTTGNVFLFLPMIRKIKNIKSLGNLIYSPTRTNQIASCFDFLSIT